MAKIIMTPKMWEELDAVLRKLQIGYTISFNSHSPSHYEALIEIDPIGVQYYEDKAGN